MTIEQFARNLKTAIATIDNIVSDTVEDNATVIAEFNSDSLFSGRDVDGNIIGIYSKKTQFLSKGQSGLGFPKIAGQPFNFMSTGDLLDSIKVIYRNGDIVFSFGDLGAEEKIFNIEKFSFPNRQKEKFLGIGGASKKALFKIILNPSITKKIQNVLNGHS